MELLKLFIGIDIGTLLASFATAYESIPDQPD